MELKHIKGIGPAKQAKLTEAGVKDVRALAEADLDAVAKTTGISVATLKEYKEAAVGMLLMEDIKGMGPNTVKTLAEAGVKSLKDLYEASTDYVAAQTKVAQEKAGKWQEEAKTLYERVRADAQTSEGRQKLVAEGKDLAKKAAETTQKTATELFERAQKEGEAAIAKAKELREKAPDMLQDYRKKAEEALKAAEAQVKALQEKTPETVKGYQAKAEAAVKDAQVKIEELRAKTEEFAKAEIEKVKVANEGFLKKIKARFVKA